MADKTGIEWTDATWTPLRARVKADAGVIAAENGYTSLVQIATNMQGHVGPHCEHVSPGCENCYSETSNHRCLPNNGTGLPFDRRARDLVNTFIDEKILMQPLKWKKGRKIFVCSQTDLFGEWVTDEMIDRVFGIMALCPEHRWQVLTKRPERMLRYLTNDGNEDDESMRDRLDTAVSDIACHANMDAPERWPLPNVYIGVSVEDQQRADERIPLLLKTPAAVRWLSCEPLLGPIRLGDMTGISWSVIGGESGHGARPMRIEWAESLIEQCRDAGVACFVKQLGERPNWALSKAAPIVAARGKCGKPEEWPESLRVRQFPEVR